MKKFIYTLILLIGFTAFSQEQKVEYKKTDNNLIEATYYFASNSAVIERVGFFNANEKLQGTWISYDLQGNKTVIANYNNGIKEGVWTYYKQDKISIVTYKNNKISNVEEKALAVN